MWRRTYLLLLLVRIYFALSPSYLHPDENFQGPEVIAGMVNCMRKESQMFLIPCQARSSLILATAPGNGHPRTQFAASFRYGQSTAFP